MTYRAEVGGVSVPDMLTEGGTSHEHTAEMVAQVSHPGDIITVESGEDESLDRRWFRVLAPAPGTLTRTVEEITKTASGNVIRFRGRDD